MHRTLVASLTVSTLVMGITVGATASAPVPYSAAAVGAAQQTGHYHAERPFGTLREQADIQQEWVRERLEVNLPKIMRQQGVDMWVVSMREYNEDPVFRALVSPTSFAARRR